MKKPGVMLYFEMRGCMKWLTMEEKGMLLDAILDYGEDGTEPDFRNPGIAIAWEFVRRDIDRDTERYWSMVSKRQYAVYVRDARRNNLTPLSWEDWQAEQTPNAYTELACMLPQGSAGVSGDVS